MSGVLTLLTTGSGLPCIIKKRTFAKVESQFIQISSHVYPQEIHDPRSFVGKSITCSYLEPLKPTNFLIDGFWVISSQFFIRKDLLSSSNW